MELRDFFGTGAQGYADGVLAKELASIAARRTRNFSSGPAGYGSLPPTGEFPPGVTIGEESVERAPKYEAAHAARPLGLAFSGGGIRSATFNLGVLQALAEIGALNSVDYLSTVSGGGYIGSWLHALVRRRGGTPVAATELLSPQQHPEPDPPQADPISFLRKFSNYLAPRPGAFSVDSWVIGTIWLRNVLLNQLVMLPAFAALAALAVAAGCAEHWSVNVAGNYGAEPGWRQWALYYSTTLLIALAMAPFIVGIYCAYTVLRGIVLQTFGGAALPPGARWDAIPPRATRRRSTAAAALMFAGALVLGVIVPVNTPEAGKTYLDYSPFTHPYSSGHPYSNVALILGVYLLMFVLQHKGGFPQCYAVARGREYRAWAYLHAVWMSALSTALTAWLIFIVWYRLPWDALGADASPWLRVALGPTLVCLSLLAGGTLQTGLMGADYPDAAREWMARIAATVGRWCLYWSGFFALAVFAPWACARLLGAWSAASLSAGVAWAVTVGSGVLAGHSDRTGGAEAPSTWGKAALQWLVAAAPLLFIAGYLTIIAAGVHLAVKSDAQWDPVPDPRAGSSAWLDRHLAPARQFAAQYWTALAGDITDSGYPVPSEERLEWLLLIIGICGAAGAVANWRININEFSMHHFYKNRLVRCYLGASNEARNPNAFTGFDSTDDVYLSDLEPSRGYYGPYA